MIETIISGYGVSKVVAPVATASVVSHAPAYGAYGAYGGYGVSKVVTPAYGLGYGMPYIYSALNLSLR